jgi:DNA mismatch endonuclease (patch repair protein)
MTKSEQMARVRSTETGPEVALRRSLWHAGARYRVRPRLPGTPDLAFMAARMAVFVDGCFWHGCPSHYREPITNADFWKAKLARNVRRDAAVDAELARMGWTVLRVWEHELRAAPEAVLDTVLSAARSGAARVTA